MSASAGGALGARTPFRESQEHDFQYIDSSALVRHIGALCGSNIDAYLAHHREASEADCPDMSKSALLDSMTSAVATGFEELVGGARNWRVWHLLGSRDLRHRYARSRFGQAWLTLSTAIMIGVLAAVWSLLWNQPLHDLMPFIGIGLIMWNFLAQTLTEFAAAFVTHGQYYRNQKMNFSVSIYSVVYKNIIILGYGLIVILFLIVAFRVPVNWYLLQIVPGFALTCIMLTWSGYIIAMACVRYRDIVQVITTWLTVWFFVTPVMWKPDFLPSKYHFIVDFNPLAQFLELLRKPFLGDAVGLHTWITTTVIAVGGIFLAIPIIGRYHRRVIFWM
jgi:ABC-type polysaccharide/polyol phosphate export permease